MKIGFTGTASTGKTTLANKIEGFINPGSPSRMVAKINGGINKDATTEDQLLSTTLRIVLENQIKEDMVCERTIIDSLAYTLWLIKNKWGINEKTNLLWNISYELGKEHIKTYDKIFYLPPSLPVELDEFRIEDKDFHHSVNMNILSLLGSYGVEYVTIDVLDLEERLKIVNEYIVKQKERL